MEIGQVKKEDKDFVCTVVILYEKRRMRKNEYRRGLCQMFDINPCTVLNTRVTVLPMRTFLQ